MAPLEFITLLTKGSYLTILWPSPCTDNLFS